MVNYSIETGSSNRALRAEVVDSLVKQTAARQFKFMQALAVEPTSSWDNTFFREDLTISSGPAGNVFKGVPRGAAFPQGNTKWEEVTVRILKFAVEANIPYEDIISGTINVQARHVVRRTEEIVKAVDDAIWDSLTQNVMTDSNLRIQSHAITLNRFWDYASAAIIDDMMEASRLINVNGNYDTTNLICFINPKQRKYVMKYFADKGTQWPALAQGIAENGRIGRIAGVDLVVSTSVAASYALVVIPKTCATWKELVPLSTDTTVDPLKSTRIRVVQEGVVAVTDPLAICLIKGTDSPTA